jgi:hypothetical protein
MYQLIVDNLAESPGIRKEDVFIGVVEVAPRELMGLRTPHRRARTRHASN